MDLAALIVSIIAAIAGCWALLLATDPFTRPKILASRRKRHGFICPCGHDYVFHARTGARSCQHDKRRDYDSGTACRCQGYAGAVPPPTLEELLRGGSS